MANTYVEIGKTHPLRAKLALCVFAVRGWRLEALLATKAKHQGGLEVSLGTIKTHRIDYHSGTFFWDRESGKQDLGRAQTKPNDRK